MDLMTSAFGRKWQHRFFDSSGLIEVGRWPAGVSTLLDEQDLPRVVELFDQDMGISIRRIERESSADGWVEVPLP